MEQSLSAGSLLLAVIGLVFGLWHSSITRALALDVSGPSVDLNPERAQLTGALAKTVVLAISAGLATAVFLPLTIKEFGAIQTCGASAECYSATSATFVLIQALMALLCLYLSWQASAVIFKLFKSNKS